MEIIAAFGWLSLGSQSPSANGVSSPPPAQNEHPQNPAQTSANKPAPIVVTLVESVEQAEAAKRVQTESRQHDSRDLDAQIRAADAAENQLFPSWFGAILSFMGTGLIVWTLFETRKANAVARKEFVRARIESKKARR